jgi:hypothetical protein
MGSPWAAWGDMPQLVDANGMSSQAPRTIPPPPGATVMPNGPAPRSAPTSTPQYPWGTPHPQYVSHFAFAAQLGHIIITVIPSPTHKSHMLHGVSCTIPQLIHSNRRRVLTSRVNPCTPSHNRTIILAEPTAYRTRNQGPARDRILFIFTYRGHRRAIYRP